MQKKIAAAVIFCLLLLATAVFFLLKPVDKSVNALSYYSGIKTPPVKPLEWLQKGKYIQWKSSLPENSGFKGLNIFTITIGNKSKPAILLIHGYPTSSYDFYKLAAELGNDFYLCMIDTPGYGFSDKPGGYKYSLHDDAALADFAVKNIFDLKDFTLLTHDKGDSVGLALLEIYQAYKKKPYRINNHIIMNGNMYLPLARLNIGQKVILNPVAGKIFPSLMTGKSFANGLAEAAYTPVPSLDEINALASIFDYQNGTGIQHQLIQYLNERKVNEVKWLETLGKSDIPVTLIWGELDKIAPAAVADYIWEKYIRPRKALSSYWRIPLANHYLQHDQAAALSEIIKFTLGVRAKPDFSGNNCIPYLAGRESETITRADQVQGEKNSMPEIIESRFIKANNLRFHIFTAGRKDGKPLILLHGFPDAAFGWEKQIVSLAQAGYFVIAPDQRGYNLSDKPAEKTDYMMGKLMQDIISIADVLNFRKFYLAGHDFGAIVSWYLADRHPDRIVKMAILNVPHPKVMNDFLISNSEQRSRSWYAFFFKVPAVPEFALSAFNWKALSKSMSGSFTNEEMMRYRSAWSQENSLSAMLNWYRCLFLISENEKPKNKISVPTIIIWGRKDPHLMWQMVHGSADMCDDSRIVFFEDATHWVMREKPGDVSRLLIEHFK
jgi:pimeloyl-ACP methyl ester carboxylesterase